MKLGPRVQAADEVARRLALFLSHGGERECGTGCSRISLRLCVSATRRWVVSLTKPPRPQDTRPTRSTPPFAPWRLCAFALS